MCYYDEHYVAIRMKVLTLVLTLTAYVLATDSELHGNGVNVENNAVHQAEKLSRGIIANAIKNFLNDFRDTVVNGNGNIPPLDPLNVPHIGPLQHSKTGVRVDVNLYNVNLEGLKWYLIDDVTVNALRLSIGIKTTIPWIIISGSYDATARITLISHSAWGNFRIFVNRLETSVDVRLGTKILGGGTLILRDLNIGIVIHDVQINISGIVGSPTLNSLINSYVQNAAQNLLRDELETISQALSRELFDVVSEFLGKFTIDDLLG